MRRSTGTKLVRTDHGNEGRTMPGLHRTGSLSGVFEGMDRMMEETFGSTLRRMGFVPLGEIFHGLSGEMIPGPSICSRTGEPWC